MTRNVRALILSGVVGIAGVLGSGATTAKAQGYGPYGPGRGFSLSIGAGDPYGYGYGQGGYYPGALYRRGYGLGSPGYGYSRGYYGLGYAPSYYSSRTTITTIIYCDRCGRYHDRHAPCGGRSYGRGYRDRYDPVPYPW